MFTNEMISTIQDFDSGDKVLVSQQKTLEDVHQKPFVSISLIAVSIKAFNGKSGMSLF